MGAAAAAAVAAPAVPVTAPTEDVHNGMNQNRMPAILPNVHTVWNILLYFF